MKDTSDFTLMAKRNILVVVSAALLALICGLVVFRATQKAPQENSVATREATGTPSYASNGLQFSDPTASWEYTNRTYHFSLRLPKQASVGAESGCSAAGPVEAGQEGNAIVLGAHITGCPRDIDPHALFGWSLYATNGVATVADATSFVRESLGPGCTANYTHENSSLADERADGAFTIVASDPTKTETAIACQATAFYSQRWHTLVLIPETHETEFLGRGGSYDAAVAASFHFLPEPR